MIVTAVKEKMALVHEPRDRMFAILFLIALQPLFWGLFEQAGGSLNLFTDRYIDLGGVPAPIFQSINPIYIILLAPLFAWLWTFLGKRKLEPSTPAKFGLGLMQLGFGFLVLVWGAATVGPGALVPVIFLFGIYFFHTTGELCLSPVGLPDHGCLVLRDSRRQLCCRDDRRGHGRRGWCHEPRIDAVDLLVHRSGCDRSGDFRDCHILHGETLDASRYAR